MSALTIPDLEQPIGLHGAVPLAVGICPDCGGESAHDVLCQDCARAPDDEDDGYPGRCTHPDGHDWVFTGAGYGGDDESYLGEGRSYCANCLADGDA